MGVAFEQFKDSLQLAVSLKKLEREHYPPAPKLDQQPFVKGLRGGAAVLMVAAFEFFLNRLFQENISKLNTVPKTIDFDKLPERLKVKTVFIGLQRAMEGPRYEERPPKVDRIGNILATCKALINEQIDPETFCAPGNNPNSDAVKDMFKAVGISDIFGKIKSDFESKWNGPVAQDFIKATLDEIVRSRHVVAHTADTLHISRKSQNDSLKFLKVLAEILERKLNQQIAKIIKDAKV